MVFSHTRKLSLLLVVLMVANAMLFINQYVYNLSTPTNSAWCPKSVTTTTTYPQSPDASRSENSIGTTSTSLEAKTNQSVSCEIKSAYSPHRSYISLALYGTEPLYWIGALRNVVLAKHVYPGWRVRIYHDNTVPQEAINKLLEEGAELVDVSGREDLKGLSKRMWRFLIADDENVDVFISRDADSRPTIREKCAVVEWLQSPYVFHTMRDHPRQHHFRPVLAGMWGMKTKEFFSRYWPNTTMLQELLKWRRSTTTIYDDETFLSNVVWPTAMKSVLIHDSYKCTQTNPPGVSFPCSRMCVYRHRYYVETTLTKMTVRVSM